MSDFWATQDEVSEAAVSTFRIVYNGKDKSLTRIRYEKSLEMFCTGLIEPEKLPQYAANVKESMWIKHLQLSEKRVKAYGSMWKLSWRRLQKQNVLFILS